MRAIHDVGVRYVVSDTSVTGQDNPSPNTGIYNSFQPSVLELPRRPTNLGYNVLTPEEWVSEYNAMFRKQWGRDLSYDEILDVESDRLLLYMLRWENDPWMFHQEDLRLYDGKHALLTNLLWLPDEMSRLFWFGVRAPPLLDRERFCFADIDSMLVFKRQRFGMVNFF